MPDVIIPRKCVTELRKLLDEVDGTVEVRCLRPRSASVSATAVLTSKLIDGTFPDYTRVIPTGNDKLLKIDPRSFEEGVDRVSTIASERTRAVKMALERDRVTLSVTSPENGTAAEEVPADYGAEGFEIGFNARYLLDILGQIEGDTVEVHLADAGRADPDPRERQGRGALRADADAGVRKHWLRKPQRRKGAGPRVIVAGRHVDELAAVAVDASYHLYREIGPGLLESVYETLLAARLERLGIKIDRQKRIDILYDGVAFRRAFVADLLLDERLLIEIKSTERTAPVHAKQLLTYLRLMQLPLGLLINFGAASFREGVRRVVNDHNP